MSRPTQSLHLKYMHQQLGKQAEDAAVRYLQRKGFRIIIRNYRHRKAEIDIIAQKNTCLVFVEVKARTSQSFGYPEEFVVAAKQKRILKAAENYILEQDWNQAIRFDVIALLQKNGSLKIMHFEDAFY